MVHFHCCQSLVWNLARDYVRRVSMCCNIRIFDFIISNKYAISKLPTYYHSNEILVGFHLNYFHAISAYKSSDVGLAISSALSLTGVFQWGNAILISLNKSIKKLQITRILVIVFILGMRQSAETENLMTSVERALEYAKLEPEASLESEPGKDSLECVENAN